MIRTRFPRALAAGLLITTCAALAAPSHAPAAPCTGTQFYGAAINYSVANKLDFVIAGDFNGDGLTDLAVTNSDYDNAGLGSRVSILIGTGPRAFAAPVAYPTGHFTIGLMVADFNHDGILDLATANRNTNDVSILIGQGSG